MGIKWRLITAESVLEEVFVWHLMVHLLLHVMARTDELLPPSVELSSGGQAIESVQDLLRTVLGIHLIPGHRNSLSSNLKSLFWV